MRSQDDITQDIENDTLSYGPKNLELPCTNTMVFFNLMIYILASTNNIMSQGKMMMKLSLDLMLAFLGYLAQSRILVHAQNQAGFCNSVSIYHLQNYT